ncbi:hypothetical protein WEI85_38040 [Actinomycetes bacterium KLBMP 9797]
MAMAEDPHLRYQQQKARADRGESRVKLLTAVVTLITAIAGALGVFSGVSAKKADTATDKADASSAEVKRLEKLNSDLQSQLASTQQKLNELKASSPPTGTDESGSPQNSAGPVETLHEGRATVPLGASIDVDALPSDPQWGMLRPRVQGGPWDLNWRNNCDGAICLENFSKGLLVGDRASVNDCTTTTGYNSSSVPMSKIRTGLKICVFTRDGRYSLVRIAKFTSADDAIVWDIETLKKSGD